MEGVCNEMILVPMTMFPEGPKLTGVPEMVRPGPPAVSAVPARDMTVGFKVRGWPATVYIDGGAEAGYVCRGMVLPPTTKFPEGPKLTGVPEIVTPGPFGTRVVPAREMAVGFAVIW